MSSEESMQFRKQTQNSEQHVPKLKVLDTEIDLIEVPNNSFTATNVQTVVRSAFQ
jgi:hypothetical protein